LFRRELFNRIDRVVTFESLDRRTIEQIAQRGIALRFSPALVAEVAKTGFSPMYGARPLQRAIERLVGPVLTERLLGEELSCSTIILFFF